MSDRSYSPELFFSENSPYARICRMALRERGLLGQVKETVTALRDPKAVVLPHNPTGRVPALLLPDGTTLTETTLILQWLDQQGTRAAMMPAGTKGIAAYGRVLGLLDGIAVWNRELRRPENERSPSVLKLEAVRADRIADALERDVAGAVLMPRLTWVHWRSWLCLATPKDATEYGRGARVMQHLKSGSKPFRTDPRLQKQYRRYKPSSMPSILTAIYLHWVMAVR